MLGLTRRELETCPPGAGLRPGAKAPDEPPDPTGGAPALDPTGERGEETCTGLGLRPGRESAGQATDPYRLRAYPRLY